MTQEEKAKAYDEALEIARQIHNGNPSSGTAIVVCEQIFPQLRESEDERIRKFLKDYAIEMIAGLESDISISVYDGVKGHDPDAEEELEKWRKARAWLENQKEQKKPILFKRDCTDFEIEVHEIIAQARNDSRLNDADVLKQFEEEAAFALMLKANKLMEQKPAELETLGKPMTHEEWAEDYWEHHKFASPNGNDKCDVIQFEHKGFIDFCMAYCVDQKPQDRLVLHDTFGYEKGRQVGQREGVEMVLKTPESYGLYKPAEWSEEIIRKAVKEVGLTQHQIDWFKTNVFPPKQEWSKEDEKMLKNILWVLESYISKGESAASQSLIVSYPTYYKEIDWLKSLRPSWKPSEEQMEAFRKYIEDFQAKAEAAVGGWDNFDVMIRLYEQLKKL